MASSSKIEWTDSTWNPVRGCSYASEGCRHCYAAEMAGRFDKPGLPFEGLTRRTESGLKWSGKVLLVGSKLADPLRWKTPRKIFVNSVSDLFHRKVTDEFIVDVARVMVAARWHTYQVLTKRSRRMAELLSGELRFAAEQSHILWGVTCENRAALPRLDDLRSTPSLLRYVSFEPLLEDLGDVDLTGINWVIVGGESGRSARPLSKDWILSLRRQATKQGAAFFFKQWGGKRPKRTGCTLDGLQYKEYPSVNTLCVPSNSERQRLITAERESYFAGMDLLV